MGKETQEKIACYVACLLYGYGDMEDVVWSELTECEIQGCYQNANAILSLIQPKEKPPTSPVGYV